MQDKYDVVETIDRGDGHAPIKGVLANCFPLTKCDAEELATRERRMTYIKDVRVVKTRRFAAEAENVR